MSKTKQKQSKEVKETPLMKQYYQVKAKYPGSMLLFRVGDFYELFGDDAVTASKILDITLTKRANGSASEVALAGFPHHALDAYLPKLVRNGQRVAVCDQLEDPSQAKGVVQRGVTELVTPGVSFNDNVLDVKSNNYLASVHFNDKEYGIAFLDISTGEFFTSQGSEQYIDKLLQHFRPSEVIFAKGYKKYFPERFGDKFTTYTLDDWVYAYDYSYETLTRHFGTTSLKGFGIENLQAGIVAAGAIIHYLDETEHKDVKHVASISRLEEERYVWLDKFSARNLELLQAQSEDGIPLLDTLDHTLTPMGGRTLKKWLLLPLKEKALIDERLDIVDALQQEPELLEEIRGYLRHIGDLERLISKVAVRRINPREMNQLRKALENIQPLKERLENSGHQRLQELGEQLNECQPLIRQISERLVDDPPLVTNQGNLIRDGVDEELDELRKIAYSGKDYLNELQQKESERTGIPSLKVSYNKVFGYYLEVRNVHKDKVPAEWVRKQTLVNAERYITEELKNYEEKILNSEEKTMVIEQRLFNDLVAIASGYVEPVQQNASLIARLDCLASFALTARENQYTRPAVDESKTLDIRDGRHPVIEKSLPLGESYIPNDIYLDEESRQIMVITGPNMAGKSALLRQTAIIVLMGQMGCFVPAGSAQIGLIDKIFTRVGASDNLSKGESTFMVEMTETASILHNLSDRSLILMDEIGRGTSTYDGISIAWSIVEYLHNHQQARPKTLFATHYHELNQLSSTLERVKNFNVSVKEVNGKIVFLRKLKEGGSEHSFGIHVAQMAGMPQSIIKRADKILEHLEKDKIEDDNKEKITEAPNPNYQLNLFETDPTAEKIRKMVEEVDINSLSPVEALLKLNEIKDMTKGQEENGSHKEEEEE